jgi:uncharacterized membrane protein YjjP (DUF1212 family)
MDTNQERVLSLATEAGHILLENGAEISRVEETIQHIATAYGVENESFYVLSNGIIATGQHYARAEFIPIKGTQLSRVVEVNQLSREVSGGTVSLDELETRLKTIRQSPAKPWWELTLGVALGVSSFCLLFGGSFVDAATTFAAGLLLGLFMAFIGGKMTRIFGNLLGGLLGGLLCILSVRLNIGQHLPNMIIGTIIALVPGVPFTNGMRDIANEDYLSGTTRLLDAFLVFLCIALGVALAFLFDGALFGGMMVLGVPVADTVTRAWYVQLPAAFIGTVGFAALFGTPRRYYLASGLTGMLGWAVFIVLAWYTEWLSVAGAAFFGALTVALASGMLAVWRRCPTTVFLICGIIPLVPGGGIFWTAYYLVSNQLLLAITTGYSALKVTIAIAGGIITLAALTSRLQKRVNRRISRSAFVRTITQS